MPNPDTAKKEFLQVRIGGFGGQGIVLAGLLLGKAASIYDGKEAVFTQSYGPEARGGASNVDLIISSETIDYPLVTEPDILVVLFQEAYTRFRPILKKGGVLILEENLVHHTENDGEFWQIPATNLAEELGRKIVMNVIVVGFLVAKTGIVTRDAAEEAIRTTVRKKTVDFNLKAFARGYEYAQGGC